MEKQLSILQIIVRNFQNHEQFGFFSSTFFFFILNKNLFPEKHCFFRPEKNKLFNIKSIKKYGRKKYLLKEKC